MAIQGELAHNDESVKNWFRKLTDQQREQNRLHYEKLLLIESGKYRPAIYSITSKLFPGRQKPYPVMMPWMVKSWTN